MSPHITRTRRTAERLAGLALAGATILASAPAAAANVTINTANISGGHDPKDGRPPGQQFTMSHADCVDADWYIQFPVQITASAGGSLQIWASEGSSCTNDLTRDEQCVKLPVVSPQVGYYKLTAKQIIKAFDDVNPTTCDGTNTDQAPRTLTLYFLLMNTGTDTDGTVSSDNTATYPMIIDLVGPPAPSGITLGVGDRMLKVVRPNISADADTYGYYVYVRDAASASPSSSSSVASSGGGTGGTGGASSSSSAGTGGAGTGGAGTGGMGGGTSSSSGTTTTTTGTGGAGGTGGTGGSGGEGGGESSSCLSTDSIPDTNPATSPDVVRDTWVATARDMTILKLADGNPPRTTIATSSASRLSTRWATSARSPRSSAARPSEPSRSSASIAPTAVPAA
ncbi:PE-PGRS family protein [Minicystis rosea]|nr:PE-PGRS family protein [Minicystis rosea]